MPLPTLRRLLGDALTAWRGNRSTSQHSATPSAHTTGGVPAPFPGQYPGDFIGVPHFSYTPHNDDRPDPGEVVWTWVPFEEDTRVGKDRPVLLLGVDAGWLLAAPLTSQDHDRDAAQEASQGRYWMDIGSGDWDPKHRASEVRLNRVIRVSPKHVRRTSGRIDAELFHQVTVAISQHLR